MKRLIVLSIICKSMMLNAQEENKGIQFIQGLNWEQVKAKAKAEGKYIFMDCFTTWCAPCQEMEKKIYPLEYVGSFFNTHFISIKIQMDTTYRDNKQVKSWYPDAQKIANDYEVNAYPTFLFFSPNGKIVHRAAGGYPANRFISLAKDALDSVKQYYTLLANYHPENMSLPEMRKMADSLRYNGPELAQRIVLDYLNRLNSDELYNEENLSLFRKFKQIPAVQKLADQYINSLTVSVLKNRLTQLFVGDFEQLPKAKQLADQYIGKLSNNDLRERNNSLFIIAFLKNSSDIGFRIYYTHTQIIDEILGTGYGEGWIASIINKEEIDPILDPIMLSNRVAAPDWKRLFLKIEKKYGTQYAGYCTSFAKCKWYSFKKDHKGFFKSQMLLYDKYGATTSSPFNLNNAAWDIFLHSKDTTELRKAISWSERAVKMDPAANSIDTYANLLYKIGQLKEALRWEEVATKLEPDNKDFIINLNKMGNGEPTWTAR